MAPEERKRPKRPAPEPPQQGQPAEQAQQQGPGPEEQVAQSPAAAKGKAKAKLPELRIRLPKPFETKDGADATEGDFVFIEANLENARGEPYQYVCTWVTDIPVAAMWDDGRILSRRVKLDTSGVDPRNHAVELIVSEWEPEELVEAEPDWYAELEEEEVPDEDEDEPPNDDSAAGYVAGRSLPPIAGAQIGGPPNSRATGLTASRRTTVRVRSRPIGRGDVVPVALRRTQVPPTPDQALWSMIRNSALTWPRYARFMDIVMCGEAPVDRGERRRLHVREARADRDVVKHRLRLPYPDVDAYRQLKVATEVFMMVTCGVVPDFRSLTVEELAAESRRYYRAIQAGDIEAYWRQLLSEGRAIAGDVDTVPYLALVRRKLKDVQIVTPRRGGPFRQPEEVAAQCYDIIMDKLTNPCLLELIWSYWHEEGMLAQTMNAISWRFQNRHGPADRDPLALVEIDPLRPLNNFVWGYIQDEEHRLSVPRRAYEYDHHYGLTLLGKAVPPVRGADSRSRFLEAFHHLLYVCAIFFNQDDDTTVVADGFPVLNALKEVHLLLTQGAHNQYGDLPWTSRQEMLMEMWLLARPEFREFLPRRIMVDYPEEWMDSVETMKTLQGWQSASILHFRDLGVFGEQVLLGVRFGAWPSVIESDHASNWARYWRPEIQGYIHAYRAVTGVDLTQRVDATMPAVLLRRRLAPQATGR